MKTQDVVITSAVRTAIGSFGCALRDVPAVQLGSTVVHEVLKRKGLRPVPPKENVEFRPKLLPKGVIKLEKFGTWDDSLKEIAVDEVIMGNVLQAGQGQNVARQAALYGGLPKEVNAFTVNKVCASGLKAISLGAQAIVTGAANVIVAGGMESMSNAPYALPRARWGYKMDLSGAGEVCDLMVLDGLFETFYGYHMGITAENIAEKYGITRQEQDELGLLSHLRARAAIKEGMFKEEITPVTILQKKGEPIVFDTDERPMETSMERMSKLPPAFKKDGTVTAGNSAGINDAAAAVLLMNEEEAKRLGLQPLARILGFASGAVDPAYMGVGPAPAVRKALNIAGLTLDDVSLVELNEAFASQTIACMRELVLSRDNTNIYGSGISLGHPIGCTGARVTVTLLYAMKRRNARYGLATMCIGGGQGMAMVFERC
ncbi:MAG TPA: acetyl-CoA C-acetyltransferase [Candidatus Bathyarchaeia archaeon]|nr:acetyl-CoA C-acetyltransferase [Candidatus Bathyarchaeia archaeon]